MCGIENTGKSTLAKKIYDQLDPRKVKIVDNVARSLRDDSKEKIDYQREVFDTYSNKLFGYSKKDIISSRALIDTVYYTSFIDKDVALDMYNECVMLYKTTKKMIKVVLCDNVYKDTHRFENDLNIFYFFYSQLKKDLKENKNISFAKNDGRVYR